MIGGFLQKTGEISIAYEARVMVVEFKRCEFGHNTEVISSPEHQLGCQFQHRTNQTLQLVSDSSSDHDICIAVAHDDGFRCDAKANGLCHAARCAAGPCLPQSMAAQSALKFSATFTGRASASWLSVQASHCGRRLQTRRHCRSGAVGGRGAHESR